MFKRPSVKILVCYHKKDALYKNEVLTPIHCGRALALEASKDGKMSQEDYQWMLDNMIGDDTGDNISHFNRDVSEFSAIYWAWKNYDKLGDPDYIGLCHYRRFFNFSEFASQPDSKDIVEQCGNTYIDIVKLLDKYNFILYRGGKVKKEDELMLTFEPYQTFVNLSDNYHPIINNEYIKFKKEKVFHGCSMFVMKKEDFMNMCEEIFPILFDVMQRPKQENMQKAIEWNRQNKSDIEFVEYIDYVNKNNGFKPRYYGYMMEYIISFYLTHLQKKYCNNCLMSLIVDFNDYAKLKLNFVEKIFSVKDLTKYKVITIIGIKIKIKRKVKR